MRITVLLAAWVALASLGAAPARAGCVLAKMAELPVTMVGIQPLLNAKINGRPIRLMTDSGAFYSLISRADALELGLTMQAAPQNLSLVGVGGYADVEVTHVATFSIVGVDLHDIEFLVGGTAISSTGVLGRNVLAFADTEYDLGEGAIRLFRPHGCGGAQMAYWAGDRPVTVVSTAWSNSPVPPAIVPVKVDGVALRALMDTGASNTVMTLAAARRVGIDVKAMGAPRGVSTGIGRRPVRVWLVPIASFEIGDEKVTNAKIGVIDGDIGDDEDMLLGADFFLSHRVYVAKSQGKVYITYQGGPVFDLSEHPKVAPQDQALADGAEPKDAEGFSRRGSVYLARGDKSQATADFDKAVALAPKEPRYRVQRAQARIATGQLFLAMGDLDTALALDPTDLDAHVMRAELRRAGHDEAGAMEDIAAATKGAAPESNQRLVIANQDMGMQQFGAAIDQYDLWIRYHSDDANLGRAYEGLCFSQAMTGRDLDRAVGECNRAVGLRTNSVRPMAARALVRVRRGEFARAIADDDAALKLTSRAPWALYGRGLAELRTGDAQAGKADLDAAAKMYPAIEDEAKRAGLAPDSAKTSAAPTAATSPGGQSAPS